MLTNIFKEAEILDKNKHKDLGLVPYVNYKFAKDVYLAPITYEEMLVANKSLIIVFVKDTEGTIYPSVVLGGEESSNLLLDDDFVWKKNYYIPAVLRCYPFGVGTDGNNNFITLDVESDCTVVNKGSKIIQDTESFTDHGKKSIDFVTNVYSSIHLAKQFTDHLNSLGVLKQAEISIETEGKKYILKSGIYIVDENTLNKLESRKLKKLASMGYMKLIYAHLFSLNNSY